MVIQMQCGCPSAGRTHVPGGMRLAVGERMC